MLTGNMARKTEATSRGGGSMDNGSWTMVEDNGGPVEDTLAEARDRTKPQHYLSEWK